MNTHLLKDTIPFRNTAWCSNSNTTQALSSPRDIFVRIGWLAAYTSVAAVPGSLQEIKGISKREMPFSETSPVYDILIKHIASNLSDIELAMYCFDFTHIAYSATILQGLLQEMGLSSLERLARQIGTMANESRLPEIKNILLALKKGIANKIFDAN